MKREDQINDKVIDKLGKVENIIMLGNNRIPKVCIYSFLIMSRKGKFLNP